MQKIIVNLLRKVVILLVAISTFSCSDDDDLSNLSETLFVRHKDADMPAYIHGNASEKIFLITLHGGPGGVGLDFRLDMFKNRIEKACAVVYFDQRGSGMSQGSYNENGMSVDIMAEDVLALVKVIKHKYGNDSRFFLMGHSWGGTLGTATLLKDQNQFLGWIDVDGVHDPKALYQEYINNFQQIATQQLAQGNSIEFWEGTLNLVNNVPTAYSEEHFFDMNRKAFYAEKELEGDGFIDRHNENSSIFFEYNLITAFWNNGTILSLLTDQGLWQELSYTDQLSEITIPSLITWGAYDMIVPATFAQEAYDHLGSTSKELIIFENSGHAPLLTEGDRFADALIRFIDENK